MTPEPDRPSMPSRESAALSLALATEAQGAVGSLAPGRWYGTSLSAALAGVYFSQLLPDPLDLVGLALMYVLMLTVIVVQLSSSGVRHRMHPSMKRGAILCGVLGLVTFLGAMVLEDWAGMPWIWVPAGLLVAGGVHVLDHKARQKGIPTP
ncbi:hypothetical protein [Streptomyces cinnamoneus]|nr:hypothetical protein [Streptomyces cinnamoneus]